VTFFFESDLPLCIYDARSGDTYIQLKPSDLSYVRLVVYSRSTEGFGACIGEVTLNDSVIMEQIKRYMNSDMKVAKYAVIEDRKQSSEMITSNQLHRKVH
jgi:hypothetical protein